MLRCVMLYHVCWCVLYMHVCIYVLCWWELTPMKIGQDWWQWALIQIGDLTLIRWKSQMLLWRITFLHGKTHYFYGLFPVLSINDPSPKSPAAAVPCLQWYSVPATVDAPEIRLLPWAKSWRIPRRTCPVQVRGEPPGGWGACGVPEKNRHWVRDMMIYDDIWWYMIYIYIQIMFNCIQIIPNISAFEPKH